MSEGTRARGRLAPAPFAIPRDGGSIPLLHNVAPLVFRALSGPAAREARASLRSAPRLEARPCPPDPPAPSTPVGLVSLIGVCVVSKPGQALSLSNSARNSPASASNIEFMSLELQRFWAISKSDRGKLCAKCVCGVVSVSRLEARPGPAAAYRHRGLARRHSNFARNSPATFSNIEFASLELQRFWAVLKSDRGKLCAKFVWRWPPRTCVSPANRPHSAPRPGSVPRSPPVPSGPSGALHTGGAWCAVVLASPVSASRSVQNSPCSASWW